MPLPGGYIWVSTAFSFAFCRMSNWPDVVLLLATRCLYWGVHLTVHCLLNCILQNVRFTWCHTALGHQMPLLGVHLTVYCLCNCIPQHVKMTLHSTFLGHQMPLLGGTSASEILNSCRVWVLHHRGLFYERPIREFIFHTHSFLCTI